MNYIRLHPGLFKSNYAFFDVPDYYADNLFVQHKIKVDFLKEFQNGENSYIAIFCRVKKKDAKEFEAVMEELEKKMIICGYTDYPEYCDKFIKTILSSREK